MASWTYADWAKEAIGSVARRDKLADHIKEVSEHITNRNYSVQQKSHSADALSRYLDRLLQIQQDEFGTNTPVDAATPATATFVRMRPLP